MAGPCICWPSGGFGDVNASGQAERADAWLGSVKSLVPTGASLHFPPARRLLSDRKRPPRAMVQP